MARERSPRSDRRSYSPPRRKRSRSPSRDRRDGPGDRDGYRDSDRGRESGRERGWDRDSGRDAASERRRRAAAGASVSALTPAQQKQLEALQQADMARQLQRQQVLLNNGAGGLNAAMAANKKQREVYCGNLAIGGVSDLMLRELFNAALAHFVADPVTRPPVVSTTMDGSGRFGFVELRTEELAAEAMKLDKINLGGREINVGRPKGYIEPPPGSVRDPNETKLRTVQPTRTLFMENLLSIGQVRIRTELEDLRVEVEAECREAGGVEAVVIPEPPAWVANEEPCPAFVRFVDEASCKVVKEMMNGRAFESNTVTAKFISDDLWQRVQDGEWVDHRVVIDNPTGANPAMQNPGAVNHYPNLLPQALVGAGYAVANPVAGSAGVPKGTGGGYVIRISNLPPTTAKHDIVTFLEGCNIGEGHVRLEKDAEGTMTGVAFVDCPSAESVARGLLQDRTQLLDTGTFVYVATSSVEERNKVMEGGHTLV